MPNLQELDEEKQPMKMDEKVVVAEEPIDAKLSLSDFCKCLQSIRHRSS